MLTHCHCFRSRKLREVTVEHNVAGHFRNMVYILNTDTGEADINLEHDHRIVWSDLSP